MSDWRGYLGTFEWKLQTNKLFDLIQKKRVLDRSVGTIILIRGASIQDKCRNILATTFQSPTRQ